MVIPYTSYMLGKGNDIVKYMLKIVLNVPRIDLMVLLHPRNVSTIIRRIMYRRRYNYLEEANTKYVKYIIKYTRMLFTRYCEMLSRNCLILDAEIEASRRAEIISDHIIGKSISYHVR